jgi:hypothetical protein
MIWTGLLRGGSQQLAALLLLDAILVGGLRRDILQHEPTENGFGIFSVASPCGRRRIAIIDRHPV